jgi:hypothetical protein
MRVWWRSTVLRSTSLLLGCEERLPPKKISPPYKTDCAYRHAQAIFCRAIAREIQRYRDHLYRCAHYSVFLRVVLVGRYNSAQAKGELAVERS